MELVIDRGNTRTKWAIFDTGVISSSGSFLNDEGVPARFEQLDEAVPTIICSVSDIRSSLSRWLDARDNVRYFDRDSIMPITSLYETPETLGLDRMANVVAASNLFPGKNALVIDAGTCITLDLIDANGVYQGGVISPGLGMRAKALNNYTEALPLVELSEPKHLVGRNTEQSMMSGIMNGTVAEVAGLVHRFEQEFLGLKIIVTGGDMKWFEHVLKSETFADAFFTLKGLHAILQHDRNEN